MKVIFIKDVKNDTYIVNGLKVDLTLPPLKAFHIYSNDSTKKWIVDPIYYMSYAGKS